MNAATDCTTLTGLPWIQRLLAMDTVSRKPNLGLIETVRDALRAQGVDSVLTHDKKHGWANLFATIPAHNGDTRGGVVLSGHTDVVPVDGQAWDSDPFQPEIRDGKLYARGSCDMKSFIGTALALVPEMLGTPLSQPIHLALSYDEEVGCAGAPLMIADLKARGVEPSGCIVGEPSGMRPIVAHKSISVYQCRVRGHAAHSSLTPRGCNAIEYAARLICHIRDMADAFRARGPFDALYDVPFCTAQTSIISGGNAVNIVPAECELSFEFRALPALSPAAILADIQRYANETLLPQMRAEHPDATIEFEPICESPGLDALEEEAITRLVRELTADQDKRKVAYGTEAGLFAEAGVPSVVCGPGHIEQAHKANEYVSLEQLAECERFLRKVIGSLSAG